MSSIWAFLNPAAGDGDQQPDRNDSQLPAPAANSMDMPTTDVKEQATHAGAGTAHTSSATNALASLSSSAGTPQQTIQAWQQRHSGSPSDHRIQQTSDNLRTSAYEQGVNSAGLPRAEELVRKSSIGSQQHGTRSPELTSRKMSSPDLQQYHMSGRSPEHMRRASIMETSHPSFKLPPLQQKNAHPSLSEGMTHPEARQDQVHHQVHLTGQAAQSNNHDSMSTAAPPASTSQPAEPTSSFTRAAGAAPTDEQRLSATPIKPEAAASTSDTISALKTDERRLSPTPIKSEAVPSTKDTIPAFIPIAAVKRDASMPATTTGETTAPVQSTESSALPEPRGTKRPAPKTKKGVARKGNPTKKQKTVNSTETMGRSKPKSGLKKSAAGTPLGSSPAPRSARAASSVGRSSPEPDLDDSDGDEQAGSADDGEYCICRKGDTGTFMIGCDGKCDDWFHGKCVGIPEKDKALIDRYICPQCTEAGVGVTTWKRMCRRAGCRMPARLAKKDAKDTEPSKYCSEECGIAFFRDMMGRTRGASETVQGRRSRKQNTVDSEEDVGPRGGAISQAELNAIVRAAPTVDKFKRLGDGVLSPPATPSPEHSKADPATLLDEPEMKRITEINKTKDELRIRHGLLKDHARFVGMLRHNCARLAEAKGMKPKDVCGYDDRVRMDEGAFAQWRESAEGKVALKTGSLPLENPKDGDGDEVMDASKRANSALDICLRKKCPKHYEWAKLSLETNRSEMSENSERMRGLEREEKEVKERAGLRTRQIKAGDFGGRAELHKVGKPDQKAALGVDGPGSGIDGGKALAQAEAQSEAAGGILPTTEAVSTKDPAVATTVD